LIYGFGVYIIHGFSANKICWLDQFFKNLQPIGVGTLLGRQKIYLSR